MAHPLPAPETGCPVLSAVSSRKGREPPAPTRPRSDSYHPSSRAFFLARTGRRIQERTTFTHPNPKLGARSCFAENYLSRAHYGNNGSIPAPAGQQKAPKRGVPPGGGAIHLLFAFSAKTNSHLFVSNCLSNSSIRGKSQISTAFPFIKSNGINAHS